MRVVGSTVDGYGDVAFDVNDICASSIAAAALSEGSRVLVVDNNLLSAEAIVFALSQSKLSARFVVPVTTSHLRDIVAWKPGVALLDIDTASDATCVECIRILQRAGIQVAVMRGTPDTYLLGACIEAGASSVVDKNSPLTDLIGIVIRMLAGESIMSEEERLMLSEHYKRESRARRARMAPFDVLTYREKCVLAELMEGHCAEVIATRTTVAISTVRSQIKTILQKLGVNSQLAAAGLARQAGWTRDANSSTNGTEQHLRVSA